MIMDRPQYTKCGCNEYFHQTDTDIPCCDACFSKAKAIPNPKDKDEVIIKCNASGCKNYFFSWLPSRTKCPDCQTARYNKKHRIQMNKPAVVAQQIIARKVKPLVVGSCKVCGSTMDCKEGNASDHWSNTCGDTCKRSFFNKFYNDLYKAWLSGLTKAEQIAISGRTVVQQDLGYAFAEFGEMEVIPLKEECYTQDYISMLASYERKIDMAENQEDKTLAERSLAKRIREVNVMLNAIPLTTDNRLVQVLNFKNAVPTGMQSHYLIKLTKGGINHTQNMEYMLSPKTMKEYNESTGSNLNKERFRLIRKYWLEAIEQGISIERYMEKNGISSWKNWLMSKGVKGVDNA